MFNTILLAPTPRGIDWDVSTLAEALLFYEKVHVVLSHTGFENYYSQLGERDLVRLVEESQAIFYFRPEMNAISSTEQIFHRFVEVSLAQKPAGNRAARSLSFLEHIEESLARAGATKEVARRLSRRLEKNLRPLKKTVGTGSYQNASNNAKQDLANAVFVRKCLVDLLQLYDPERVVVAEPELMIRDAGLDGSFLIDTKFDFDRLTLVGQKNDPTLPYLSEVSFVNIVYSSCWDLILAQRLSSSLLTNDLSNIFLKNRIDAAIAALGDDFRAATAFQDYVFSGRRVGEAIKSGGRTIGGLLDILHSKEGEHFRKWLHKIDAPDQNAVGEYIKALDKDTWIGSTRAKTWRFSICSIAPFVGDAFLPGSSLLSGPALSAVDQFLIDRLAGGWRPSSFVNGPLTNFVG